jgi:hypothetical protein
MVLEGAATFVHYNDVKWNEILLHVCFVVKTMTLHERDVLDEN